MSAVPAATVPPAPTAFAAPVIPVAPFARVDVRGTRFAGALTAAASVAVVLWPHPLGAGALALLLLLGALLGPRWNLWGVLYRRLVAPRLAPPGPERLEPAGPPRFANLLGGAFLAASAGSLAAGWAPAGVLLAGVVGLLALLNAATGFCLGCRLYGLLVLRPGARRAAARQQP